MKIDYANEYNKNVKLNVDTKGVEYKYGFAVVEKNLTETELMKVKLLRNAPKTIMGVIDEKENIIIPFKDYYSNIDIFANNNFIVITRSTEHLVEKIKVAHFHYNGSEVKLVHEFSGKYYNAIDDERVIIKESTPDGTYYAIYDINQAKFVSDKFDNISKFNNESGMEVALASRRLTLNSDNNNVYCYINKNGEIVSPIYNTFTSEYTYPKKDIYNFDFEYYIAKAKEELTKKRETDDEIVKKELIKKIEV